MSNERTERHEAAVKRASTARALAALLAVAVGAASIAACSSSAPPAPVDGNDVGGGSGGGGTGSVNGGTVSDTPTSPDGGAGAPAASGDGGEACPHQGPLLDVSGFATCLDGGRCVPGAVIPPDQQSRLATCPGGFCVPEKILANEGEYLPKSCTSLAGGEGRCTSTVFPDMAAQKDALPVDVCDPNERCAPCYDPLTGALTGACNSVSCDAPKKPKVVFASCCDGQGSATPRGTCIPKSLVPASDQSGLDQKECAAGNLCAPKETLDPKYVPPKCTASSLLGDYDGVCISTCVHQDIETELATDQGTCGAGFFCAPCKNPLDGTPTGAPGC
jgi:hypothetical protein